MGDLLTDGLRSLVNLVSGREDFRNDDIVVRLDVGTTVDSDSDVYVYVGKDGEGEIVEVDSEKFEAAQANNLGNFVNVSDLSEGAATTYAKNVAERAAGLITDHSIDESGHLTQMPYDIDGEGVGVAKSLDELRPMLERVRFDFRIEDHPGTGGKFSDPERQAVYEAEEQAWQDINETLHQIDIAQDLAKYREDLRSEAAEKLPQHAVEIVNEELNSPVGQTVTDDLTHSR